MKILGRITRRRIRQGIGNESGFTLIELIMVIVILGILGAIALPKFIDLSADAQQAAVDGVAGGLGGASAINKAACAVGNALCTTITDCNQIGPLLDGGLPNDSTGAAYVITSLAVATPNSATCTVTGDGLTSTFVAQGT